MGLKFQRVARDRNETARMWTSTFAVALVSFALVAGASFSPQSPFVAPAEAQLKFGESQDLVGTWRAQITIRNCATDVPAAFPGNPFLALITFAQGGTLTSVDAYPGLGPAQLGIALGSWKNTKHDTYSSVTEAFVFSLRGPGLESSA